MVSIRQSVVSQIGLEFTENKGTFFAKKNDLKSAKLALKVAFYS